MEQSDSTKTAVAEVKTEAEGESKNPQEAKMEVDPVVKEEKMEVDEKSVEQEKEKEKEPENVKPKILLSGMENNVRKQLTEIIERLEGTMTENPSECTHLIMPKLIRTNNFLLCLPTVKHVLRPEWVTDSGAQGSWVSEEDHVLQDPEAEARFNFSLAKTLARGSRDKLFAGKVFYLTPSVKPSLQVVSQMITSSGGR